MSGRPTLRLRVKPVVLPGGYTASEDGLTGPINIPASEIAATLPTAPGQPHWPIKVAVERPDIDLDAFCTAWAAALVTCGNRNTFTPKQVRRGFTVARRWRADPYAEFLDKPKPVRPQPTHHQPPRHPATSRRP